MSKLLSENDPASTFKYSHADNGADTNSGLLEVVTIAWGLQLIADSTKVEKKVSDIRSDRS